MKKMFIMIVLIATIVTIGITTASAELDHWDLKLRDWLGEDTIEYLTENGYEDYARFCVVNDELALGYGVISEEEELYRDFTPETIGSPEFKERLEKETFLTIHSVDWVCLGQHNGYDIYRYIVKWNEPMNVPNYGNVYGIDFFIRWMV